jgi:hypothetical protein
LTVSTTDGATTPGGDGSSAPPSVTVNLPSGMGARAEVLAQTLHLAERLDAKPVERPTHPTSLDDGGAGGGTGGSFLTPLSPLSTTGTKEFAGYEFGSTTSSTPWWSAAARNTWAAGGGGAAAVEGSVAYLIGGASVEGAACELRLVAPDALVTIDAQSWFEQRLKGKTEHRPQPYR